jgi:hypothetical protein
LDIYLKKEVNMACKSKGGACGTAKKATAKKAPAKKKK